MTQQGNTLNTAPVLSLPVKKTLRISVIQWSRPGTVILDAPISNLDLILFIDRFYFFNEKNSNRLIMQ